MISDGDIVGKYVGHVSKLGNVMDFLSSSAGFLLVIVLPMLLFFIYQVYNLIMISISLKREMAVEAAKAAEEARGTDVDAQAALEEARRMREEAEAIRAQAEEKLAAAKRKSKDDDQDAEE